MNVKENIVAKLGELTGLELSVLDQLTETPPNPQMGDLAFPCFTLAKTMRKAPPLIASDLASQFGTCEGVAKVSTAGGYLNFFFDRASYAKSIVSDILKDRENFGTSQEGNGKTVLVEFSSPNIAKPFHIGHLFSTSVGSSLEKIYKRLGYNTIKLNHLGDWGTQFGKLISAYKRWGDKETIEKDPINELLKIYVKFHEEAEKDPTLDDEAREYFKRLEDGEKETTALWQYFRDISLAEFKRVYDMLGISFDSYAGESFYGDKMDEIVELLTEKNLLIESDGAMVVDLEAEGMPPCIILKSNGTTIYATRDLAAALYRHRTYDFYKSIYVVGTPQALHFKQVFTVLKKMGYDWADGCTHVGFGLVKFPDKKLSTRNGDVVFLEDVLNEAISKTRAKIEDSDIENKDEVATKIGIGAILYTFLKNNREKDIVFSWDSMLDFDGESAPYVQYCYARAKSILRRSNIDYSGADLSLLTETDEYELIKQLGAFLSAVQSAADKNEPYFVNRYVTNVAKLFNKFYNTCPILKEDVPMDIKKARLALCEATSIVVKQALALLGIETVEKM